MTKTWKDLEDVERQIDSEFNGKIHINVLRKIIARKYGISDYVYRTISKSLFDFGFLKESNFEGFFVTKQGYNKETEEIKKKLNGNLK